MDEASGDDAVDEAAFRDEIRHFLADRLPHRLSEKVRLGRTLTKADHEFWHATLNEQGWLAPNWPPAIGGAGWGALRLHIFDEECARAYAPRVVPFGVSMLGPVLQKFGSKAQQDHWLPRILKGEDWWCQGYSEPGAGSDLAALRTEAVRQGDVYVVNGQKTWTTLGQHATMMFCLVRTDPKAKPQEGISFLLIDMSAPGVDVRPITLLDGSVEVNDVFLENVEVPVANRVGEENKGWTYAKYLLTHERTGIAGVGHCWAGLDQVKQIAGRVKTGGCALIENPHFAARLANVEIDLMALAMTSLRFAKAAAAGEALGVEPSLLKVKGTVIRQEINDLAKRAVGPLAMPFASEALEDGNEGLPDPFDAGAVAAGYFNNRKLSIFGGSNEIQREIYARTTLRDPS